MTVNVGNQVNSYSPSVVTVCHRKWMLGGIKTSTIEYRAGLKIFYTSDRAFRN